MPECLQLTRSGKLLLVWRYASLRAIVQIGKKRTYRDKWRLTSLSNKVVSIATVVIAVASVLQFCAARLQWHSMNRQLSDIESFQAAHLVIEGLADAANNNNTGMVVIRNVGESIALNMGVVQSVSILHSNTPQAVLYPTQQQIDASIQPLPPSDSGVSLASGKEMSFTFAITSGIPSHPTEGNQTGTDGEWQYLVVGYRDIFGKLHFTSDCVVYNRKGNFYDTYGLCHRDR